MRSSQRKTTPKVRDGKVQRKNRWALTPNYENTPQDRPVFDRRRAGFEPSGEMQSGIVEAAHDAVALPQSKVLLLSRVDCS